MQIPKASRMTPAAFRKLRDDGYADFAGPVPATNERPAICRVCRARLSAGAGVGYFEFMSDGYRGNARYVCKACELATRPARMMPAAAAGECYTISMSGRAYGPGTALEVIQALKRSPWEDSPPTDDQYIDWLVTQAERLTGTRLEVSGQTTEERARCLLDGMLDAGLAVRIS